MVHVPIMRFWLVIHVLLPEQVFPAVTIILNRYIEGTLRIHIPFQSHLDIHLADLRVGDGSRGVFRGFFHPLAIVRLFVDGRFAVMRTTIDELANCAREPFDDRIKTNLCHSGFSLSCETASGQAMSNFIRSCSFFLPESQRISREVLGILYLSCSGPVLILYCTDCFHNLRYS